MGPLVTKFNTLTIRIHRRYEHLYNMDVIIDDRTNTYHNLSAITCRFGELHYRSKTINGIKTKIIFKVRKNGSEFTTELNLSENGYIVHSGLYHHTQREIQILYRSTRKPRKRKKVTYVLQEETT